jgi:hypothetical protein
MKLLKYLIIFRTTKDPMMAAKIYQMIYHPELTQSTIVSINEPALSYSQPQPVSPVNVRSKKDELLASLEYLKNKKVKTKQDRDSIYTIEMVLKSMS